MSSFYCSRVLVSVWDPLISKVFTEGFSSKPGEADLKVPSADCCETASLEVAMHIETPYPWRGAGVISTIVQNWTRIKYG